MCPDLNTYGEGTISEAIEIDKMINLWVSTKLHLQLLFERPEDF